MKKIIIIICTIVLISAITFLLLPRDMQIRATMIENDKKNDVQINISCKNFHLINNNLNGDFVVVNKDGMEFKYNIEGKSFKTPTKLKWKTATRFGSKNKYEIGRLYYDRGFKNIVLISNEREIYAATDEFINVVREGN